MSIKNHKTCTECNETKSFDKFHNEESSKDGKTWYCKDCANKKSREYYKEHRKDINDVRICCDEIKSISMGGC